MHTNVSFVDFIELNKSRVLLREDDIIHIKIKDEEEINSAEFEDIIRAVSELGEAKAKCIMLEAGLNSSVSSRVRSNASHPNANFLSLADAIVVKSLAQRLMANFYLKFNRPSRPTKVFENCTDAVNWLYKVKKDLL